MAREENTKIERKIFLRFTSCIRLRKFMRGRTPVAVPSRPHLSSALIKHPPLDCSSPLALIYLLH